MSKPIPRWALPLGIAFLLTLILGKSALYTLDEIEQAVIVRFGEPRSEVSNPGLHFKVPFIDEVRRFDKRIMAWDGAPEQIPTRGRQFISVDATARWKIVNPTEYMQTMRNEAGAQSRLDAIIDSAVRDHVSSAHLVEMVRSRDWQVDASELQRAGIGDKERELLQKTISLGREKLEQNILATGQLATGQLATGQEDVDKEQLGIELVEVHIKRMNYVQSVRQEVFQRMKSERQRIAEQYRSEGLGRSEAILGQTKKEVALIRSEALRQAEVIRGNADAKASNIYNEAYTADPEFFAFYRTLESYSKSVGPGTTMLLSTDSDYFAYLRRLMPAKQGE